MTEETKDAERELEVRDNEETEIDWKAVNQELQGRIEQLEESIASRDSELAALKDSLAGAVSKYRAAVIASAPRVPEEMLKGETVEEIDASLELAQGIVAKVRQQFESDVAARSVPAGAPPRTPPDLSALPPGEKIAHALAKQQT